MMTMKLLFCVPIGFCLLSVVNLQAAVINGDFETGTLAAWPKIGAAHAATSSIGVIPTNGAYQAYVDNTGNFAATAPSVVTFLGVPGASIVGMGAGTPTTGSAISQDLVVSAGAVLTFDWNFLTDEHNEGIAFNDFAVYTIGNAAYFLASRNSTFMTLNTVSAPPGFDGQTNWATQSHTFSVGGTYKLGFAIFNVGDAGHNSVLLVDAVTLSNVPEPSTLVLALSASAICLVRRSRRWIVC